MTAGMDFSFSRAIVARTSSCVYVVHTHIGFLAGASEYSPPSVVASNCSTRPVHEPQEEDALVCARTSSSVNSFFVVIARTMSPLHTPLQPQTSALSGRFATLPAPATPESPTCAWPNSKLSRKSAIGVPSRNSWKYQEPSTVSPYSTAPVILLSLTTIFLYTPRAASWNSSSSVPVPPVKSPAENRSMPVTFSFVDVCEPA